MTVIDLKTMREVSKPPVSVVCLGNFDGVHVGHAALINEAKKQKNKLLPQYPAVSCGMCFFGIPPSSFLCPLPIPQLTSLEQKLSLFAEMGMEHAFIMDFEELGGLSPQRFVTDVLLRQIGCVHAVCGFNFRFGSRAAGTAELLGELMNGAVSVVAPIQVGGQTVSSSFIRRLIADGDVQTASALLGRAYSIKTEVLHGKALGRTIGIPTINQYFPGNLAIPKNGIYVTLTEIEGKKYPSVTNVGIRPSVNDGSHVNCETHILDFCGDLYGMSVKVSFLHRLRDEIQFSNIDMLREQIQKDISATAVFFKEAQFL